MASKVETLLAFPSQNGLNSNAPPTYLAPDELASAENIVYGLNGERKKRLGFQRYNEISVGGFNINAISDFWRYGNSLTPSQEFVMAAGGQLWKSPGDGAWTSFGSFGSNTSVTTNIITAQGFSVFSDGSNTVKKYDQTDLTDLDPNGNAPQFTAATYHLARLFAVGTAAHPSSFDVSAGGAIDTWVGADTLGNVPLDPDDGDIIVGVSKPFHKRIYMFKGPNFGSIHEISGNTLSGLEHDRIFEGLPLHNHKALITTPNDMFWLSHAGAHSLITTQQYGDTQAAFLSLPIQDFFQKELNHNNLNKAIGFWNSLYGIVGWFVPPSSSSLNTWAIVYHYLISDPSPRGKKYWSIWKLGGGLSAFSANVMLTPAASNGRGLPRLYIGGSDNGLVFAGDQTTLSDDGDPYVARVKTGINLQIGSKGPMQEAQFYSVTTFFNPVGNYDHQLRVTVDNRTQNFAIKMTGLGDVLG